MLVHTLSLHVKVHGKGSDAFSYFVQALESCCSLLISRVYSTSKARGVLAVFIPSPRLRQNRSDCERLLRTCIRDWVCRIVSTLFILVPPASKKQCGWNRAYINHRVRFSTFCLTFNLSVNFCQFGVVGYQKYSYFKVSASSTLSLYKYVRVGTKDSSTFQLEIT